MKNVSRVFLLSGLAILALVAVACSSGWKRYPCKRWGCVARSQSAHRPQSNYH